VLPAPVDNSQRDIRRSPSGLASSRRRRASYSPSSMTSDDESDTRFGDSSKEGSSTGIAPILRSVPGAPELTVTVCGIARRAQGRRSCVYWPRSHVGGEQPCRLGPSPGDGSPRSLCAHPRSSHCRRQPARSPRPADVGVHDCGCPRTSPSAEIGAEPLATTHSSAIRRRATRTIDVASRTTHRTKDHDAEVPEDRECNPPHTRGRQVEFAGSQRVILCDRRRRTGYAGATAQRSTRRCSRNDFQQHAGRGTGHLRRERDRDRRSPRVRGSWRRRRPLLGLRHHGLRWAMSTPQTIRRTSDPTHFVPVGTSSRELFKTANAVAAGYNHTCPLVTAGSRGWGDKQRGAGKLWW